MRIFAQAQVLFSVMLFCAESGKTASSSSTKRVSARRTYELIPHRRVTVPVSSTAFDPSPEAIPSTVESRYVFSGQVGNGRAIFGQKPS